VGTGAEAGIEGLTLYEAHREPMVLHDEDSDQTTTIQVRTLNVELTCPICLGIMRNTMTLMECLHRFCAECISKCLRVGKRECPTCRVHCSSRRQLRPDPEFDALIASVYPNLDEYEAQEEEFIADLNKKMSCQSHLTESVQKGILRQRSATSAAATRKRKASVASSDSTAANSALSSPSLPSSTTSTSPSRSARDTTAASSHSTKYATSVHCAFCLSIGLTTTNSLQTTEDDAAWNGAGRVSPEYRRPGELPLAASARYEANSRRRLRPGTTLREHVAKGDGEAHRGLPGL
jgi:E3 ubiquitin-protein ligase RNF1/2